MQTVVATRNRYPDQVIIPTLRPSIEPIPLSAVECELALQLRLLFGQRVLVDYDGNAHIYEGDICSAVYNERGIRIDGFHQDSGMPGL